MLNVLFIVHSHGFVFILYFIFIINFIIFNLIFETGFFIIHFPLHHDVIQQQRLNQKAYNRINKQIS